MDGLVSGVQWLRAQGTCRAARVRRPASRLLSHVGATEMSRTTRREERLGPGEVVKRLVQIVSQQETTKFCTDCNKNIRAVRPGTSRLRLLGLTILTLGVWSIVWIMDARRRPGWRCSVCDRRVG